MKTKVCIIGAGPAGLTAAIFAGRSNAATVVVEANTTAGRKLLLTGNGRCNLTHNDSIDALIRAYGPSGRFLRYCLHEFPPKSVIDFFAEKGLPTKVEKDGCVFPVSDRACDVRDVLLAEAKKAAVQFLCARGVERVTQTAAGLFEVLTSKEPILAERVVIATGGVSWPQTGSTGAGYKFAQALGHTVIEPRGVLVPLVTAENLGRELAGTSLQKVTISTVAGSKIISVRGAMLFTHDGIGGPAVLDLSRLIADRLAGGEKPVEILVDTVPELQQDALEKRLLDICTLNPKKTLLNILSELVPRRLASLLCRRLDIEAETCGSQLKKDSRKKLLRVLKALALSITDSRPITEAMVTRGGVSTEEIEPKTIESKICPGLFFAGEVINADGPCGGYNLQICWSSGFVAGRGAAVR